MKYGKQFWIDNLGKGWAIQLKDTLKSPYAEKLMDFISVEYAMSEIVPTRNNIFKAYQLCPWESVKVVIIGNVPWTNSEANGLAYGDAFTTRFHSSTLVKIYECIERNYYADSFYLDFDFTLEEWAKQGVLLLNRSLTTKQDDKNCHKKPWGTFISATINAINEYNPGTIFILWEKEAKLLAPSIHKHNYVLTYDSPSTCVYPDKDWKCPNFKEADKILLDLYGETIKW